MLIVEIFSHISHHLSLCHLCSSEIVIKFSNPILLVLTSICDLVWKTVQSICYHVISSKICTMSDILTWCNEYSNLCLQSRKLLPLVTCYFILGISLHFEQESCWLRYCSSYNQGTLLFSMIFKILNFWDSFFGFVRSLHTLKIWCCPRDLFFFKFPPTLRECLINVIVSTLCLLIPASIRYSCQFFTFINLFKVWELLSLLLLYWIIILSNYLSKSSSFENEVRQE